MIYYNSLPILEQINIAEYALKNFTKDNYAGSLDSYYKDFFEILKTTDDIVQDLFRKQSYRLTFVKNPDSLNINKNDEYRRQKILTIIHNVYFRMYDEHHIGVVVDIKENICSFEFNISIINRKEIMIYDDCSDRCTGRTTRHADAYIQMAYENWKEHIDNPINIVDHFSYDLMYRDSFRGQRINGNNMPNSFLLNKILKRIDREFPEDIKEFIRISRPQCTMQYLFQHKIGIDYDNFS